MEEDILNYSSAVMFRGTPCICIQITFNVTELFSKKLSFDMSDSRYHKPWFFDSVIKKFNWQAQIIIQKNEVV